MANPVVEWAKDNPLLAGGAALAVVVVVMLVTGGGEEESGGSGGMGAAGVQAYYAAVANQAQAGAAIQTTQIRANAETNRALIAASYGLEAVKVNSGVELRRIDAELSNNMGWAQIERERIASNERIAANEVNLANSELAARTALADAGLRTRNLGRAQRGAIVQAGITGQVVPVTYRPVNPGNSAAGIINAGGGFIRSIGSILPFF